MILYLNLQATESVWKKTLAWLLVFWQIVMLNNEPINVVMANNFTDQFRTELNLSIENQAQDVSDLDELELSAFELTSDPDSAMNLYLTLLNRDLNIAYDEALSQTAKTNNIDYFEVIAALSGQTDANKAKTIKTSFESEYKLSRQAVDLIDRNFFFDIYANGLDDAEFDLIIDLQNLHEILFTSRPETPLRSTKSPRDLERSFLEEPALKTKKNLTNANNQQSTNPQTGQVNQALENSSDEDSIDLNFCPVDPELSDLLNQNDDTSDTTNGSNQNQNNGTGSSKLGLTPEPSRNLANLLSAENRDCPPGSLFCYEIEKIYDRTQNYFPGDSDCVACQISRINKTLNNDLLSEDLYPGKVTGNFGEMSECSAAFFNIPLVDINLSLEFKPLSDQNNDALEALLATPTTKQNPERQQGISESNNTNQVAKAQNRTGDNVLDLTQTLSETENQTKIGVAQQTSANQGSENATSQNAFTLYLVPKMQEFNNSLNALKTQIQALDNKLNTLLNRPACRG